MNISLIIPCYNEEANIQKGVLDKIGNFTRHDNRFNEVIIIDDGSADSTKERIQSQYLPEFPKMRLIENTHGGKAAAIQTGIRAAKGEYVIFSDIDLATPIEEVDRLIAKIEQYDIVVGSRTSQRVGAPFTRKLMAWGFMTIRNLFIGLPIQDTQCGFKLFNRTIAIDILNHLRVFTKRHHITGSSVGAGFDLEFLFIGKKYNYKLAEVPVVWRHVETKNVHFLKDSIEAFIDILRIKYYDIRGRYEK